MISSIRIFTIEEESIVNAVLVAVLNVYCLLFGVN